MHISGGVLDRICKSFVANFSPNFQLFSAKSKDQYKWNPSIAEDVHHGYARKVATRLKDKVYKLSKVTENSAVAWCPPTVRQQLQQRREKEEFKKKSGICSSNRTTGEFGGSLYSQGSISTPEVIRRMTKEIGRVPIALEVFAKSHHTKDNKFVDQRSKSTWEKYESIKNSSETQEETAAGDDQVFLQAVGDWTEKGTVYGLGFGVHLYYERPTTTSNTTRPSKFHNREQKVEELKSDRMRMQSQIKEQNRMILALKNTMEAQGFNPCTRQWPPFSGPPPAPPSPPCPPPQI